MFTLYLKTLYGIILCFDILSFNLKLRIYFMKEFAEKAKDVGKELFRNGKYPFSLKVYEIALTKASKIETQREILSNMSLIYYKTEDFQKAKEFGKRTIDIDPSWYKV